MGLFKVAKITLQILIFSLFLVDVNAESKQLASLDHAYLVLDEETISELDESAFVKKFAFYEMIEHRERDGIRTARYLTGRSTYIELYKEGERIGPQLGVGLMSEEVGNIGSLENSLAKERLTFRSSISKKTVAGESQEFLRDLALGNNYVDIWISELLPSYMENPLSEKEPAEGPGDIISRERYLPDGYKRHQFRDITKVALELDPSLADKLILLLKNSGYKIFVSSNLYRAEGESDSVEILKQEGSKGVIREIHMQLNNISKERSVEVVGCTKIVVGPGDTAVWVFSTSCSGH